MRTVWLWLTLVACYAPSAQPGAPCAPAGAGAVRCPSGQVCVMQGGVETCQPAGAGGTDGGTDGPIGPPDDVDNDGVKNAVDICPSTPDPRQYDEDGDRVGDVCDPCPVSSTNTDGDRDGVGDDCDPNPAAGGDKIVLFDGLNQGVPPGWTAIGGWTAVAGALWATVAAGSDAALTSPFDADATSMVAAAFVTTGNVPAFNAGFGVAHVAQGEGVLCGLLSYGGRALTLLDVDTESPLDTRVYGWADQTAYITGQIRSGDQYACYSVDPQGTSFNVAGSTNEVPSQAQLQLTTRGISGRFLWLLYIDSP